MLGKEDNLQSIRNISKDFLLNIIASMVLTGTIQLLIYPQLASQMPAEEYGAMLTLMGGISVITLSLGSNLFYARMIQKKEYEEKNLTGDFQIILLVLCLMSVFATIAMGIFFKFTIMMTFSIGTQIVTTILQTYYLVVYRLHIDYKKNLFANCLMSIGYIVGVFYLIKFVNWPWIFTFANLICLLYIAKTTHIITEPIKTTVLFPVAVKKTSLLIVGGLIGNLSTYLDRFIIYPILGSESVSFYTVSCFFAKTFGLLVAPVISVLLSYLTNNQIILNKKKYTVINLCFLFMGVAYFGATCIVGKPITKVLYPDLFEDSMTYYLVSSLGVIIGSVGGFNSTTIIALAPTYWQSIMPLIRLIIYLAIGIPFSLLYGLNGFCLGVLVVNCIYCIITFVIGKYYVKLSEMKNIIS